MPTLIITVKDPECCRCSTKIQKIICCIQDRGEFVIDKITYEKDKVHVSGPFDAEKLYCKLWCKAGKIICNIEVAKPEPEPESEPKLVYPYPYPCPYPYPSTSPPCGSCPTPCGECHPKPPTPTPAPSPPQPSKPPTCQCPTWPSCHCCSYPPYRMPYPPLVVYEESPPYGACAVM